MISSVLCINLGFKLDFKAGLRVAGADPPGLRGTTGIQVVHACISWWWAEAWALFSGQASSWLALYLYSFYGKKWMYFWGQRRLEEQWMGKKHRRRDWDLKNKSENKQHELKYKKGKKPISSLTKSNSNAAFVNNRDNICFLQQMLSKYIALSLCLQALRQTQLFKYFRMHFYE